MSVNLDWSTTYGRSIVSSVHRFPTATAQHQRRNEPLQGKGKWRIGFATDYNCQTKELQRAAEETLTMQSTGASDAPGCERNIREKIIGKAEGLVQDFAPVKQIHQHVCGFHGYAHDMTRQVRAEHYCSHVNAELRQCVIYDSDKADARLIGIEYIISRRLFETLEEEEKCMWHSHRHEVMGGSLVAPEIPEMVERLEMESLVDTYGKTFHTWQYDRGDTLPLGPPQLMMSFTAEGQLDPQLPKQRDEDCGIDSEARAEARRENISPPEELASGCDVWLSGKAKQTALDQVDVKMPNER